MKPTTKIRLKALFLLATFSMNSVVGFACSVGVDMGFNSGHHEHNGKEQHKHSDTEHKDGYREDRGPYHGKKAHGNSQSHSHIKTHNYHKYHTGNTISFTAPGNDNCCKDFVVGFQSMDKRVAKGSSSIQQHVIQSSFVVPIVLGLNNTKGFITHFRVPNKQIDLPPPDILTFIHSFLI